MKISVSFVFILQQPSNNYDDSGFFSVQVIDKALHVWGLELLPYNSSNPVSQQARANPTYVLMCNTEYQ